MKAQDLRIGNWVLCEPNNASIERTIDYEDFRLAHFDSERFEPIPLTKEWLVKFGFNFDVNSGLYKKSGFEVEVFNIGVEFYLGEYGSWFLFVEHVHQLQNLYFALTGEELEIKDKHTLVSEETDETRKKVKE